MNDTSLNLRKQLPEKNIEIVRLVITAAESLEISAFIVGATARDIIFGHVYNVPIYRETTDIDFGVAVENWAQFERLKKNLVEAEEFRADSKAEHRLWRGRGNDEMKMDLIPYGDVESPAGQIAFPPAGDFVMNTNGFAEAYQSSLIVSLTDDLKVRVVSPAGLVVLKFISYNDRPHVRIRDLQDILFLMKNYLDANNENRLYEGRDSDLLQDENFDLQTVGARLLGRDMAGLLTAQAKQIIFKHLSEGESNIGLMNTAETVKRAENLLDDKLLQIIEMFRQLRQGISDFSE